MTEYHYDDQDRLAYAVTTHEPLFNEDDTDAALERTAEQAVGCPGCGNPVDEVWPDEPDQFEAERSKWASWPVKCAACAPRDAAKRRYQAGERVDMDGIFFPLARRD